MASQSDSSAQFPNVHFVVRDALAEHTTAMSLSLPSKHQLTPTNNSRTIQLNWQTTCCCCCCCCVVAAANSGATLACACALRNMGSCARKLARANQPLLKLCAVALRSRPTLTIKWWRQKPKIYQPDRPAAEPNFEPFSHTHTLEHSILELNPELKRLRDERIV